MKITPKWDFCAGSFKTEEIKMVCVGNDNHGKVSLCIKEIGCTTLFPVAEFKLYSSNLYVDFKETYEDAVKLGNEIARRWNESEVKQ